MIEQHIIECFNKLGINYECEMRPLLGADNPTAAIGDLHNTDFYGTFDTTNNRTYGCFKKNYVPVNPKDLLAELYATLPKYKMIEDAFIQISSMTEKLEITDKDVVEVVKSEGKSEVVLEKEEGEENYLLQYLRKRP